jgi:hypothetical protein
MSEREVKVEGATVVEARGLIQQSEVKRKTAAMLYPGGSSHTGGGGMTQCLIREGTTGQHQDFGSTFGEDFVIGIGTGFRCVNVQLAGWYLNFLHNDHHINIIKVRIQNVAYNVMTGEVRFRVTGDYRDKNGDDDYFWEVWYTVLALG